MKELEKIEIRMEVKNQYGDRFEIYQEVDEDYLDLGEMDIFHDAYLKFLKVAGFMIDYDARVEVLESDEYVVKECDCDDCCCE